MRGGEGAGGGRREGKGMNNAVRYEKGIAAGIKA